MKYIKTIINLHKEINMNRLTLLAVDDVEANRISLQYLLEEYFDNINIILASNGEDALKVAFTKNIDIIILDIQMPGINGFDVATYLKLNTKTKNIPIIFLTAAFRKTEFQQKGFEIGAIDYLTKPIVDSQLVNKLRLYNEIIIKTKELENKNRQLEEKNQLLKELSTTDNLTKLYNRNKLDSVLISEASRTNTYGNNFGIIIIDIDHFKKINDLYGHQMGDTTLKEFSNILSSHTRKTDTVGRWGGEEFLIICSETSLEGILILAQKLRKEISSHSFSLDKQVTASFGVSSYIKNENINELIKRADKALYKAKEKGRNIVEHI